MSNWGENKSMQKRFLEQPISQFPSTQFIRLRIGHAKCWFDVVFFFLTVYCSLLFCSLTYSIFIYLETFDHFLNKYIYLFYHICKNPYLNISICMVLHSHSTFLHVHAPLGGLILLTSFVILAHFKCSKNSHFLLQWELPSLVPEQKRSDLPKWYVNQWFLSAECLAWPCWVCEHTGKEPTKNLKLCSNSGESNTC